VIIIVIAVLAVLGFLSLIRGVGRKVT